MQVNHRGSRGHCFTKESESAVETKKTLFSVMADKWPIFKISLTLLIIHSRNSTPE